MRPETVRRVCAALTSVAVMVACVGTVDAQQQGRPLTSDDWTDTIPIVIGAVIVVLIVNGIGMYFVSLSRRHERTAGLTGPVPAAHSTPSQSAVHTPPPPQPQPPTLAHPTVQPQHAAGTSDPHSATVRIHPDGHGRDQRPTL